MARPWLWRPWAGDVEQRLPWTRRLTRCGYWNWVEGGVDMDLAPASTRVDRHCCAPQANGESAGSLAGQLLIEGRKVPLTWSPRGDSNPRPADYEDAARRQTRVEPAGKRWSEGVDAKVALPRSKKNR